MKKAFTLIELLVVVLIIGILASIALPQYQKTVEKSRLAEALINAKVIGDAFSLYVLENGRPTTNSGIDFKDMGAAVQLTGGTWDGTNYKTKYFEYHGMGCLQINCAAEIIRIPNYEYTLVVDDVNGNACYTQQTDLGRYICKSIESQGWHYYDIEY